MIRTLLALSLAAASAFAQFGPSSGPAATFLTITPDARTAALGGAGVALDSLDGNTYYNPANVTSGSPMAATWTHDHWLGDDMSIDHAGVAYRPSGRLGIAANVQYFQISFASTDEHGRVIGTTRWYDVAPSVSAAYRLVPAVSAGLTVKAIYQRVAWSGGRVLDFLTSACDVGVQYRPLDALTLGLAVANLGPIIGNHTAPGYYLPRVARLGFAIRPSLPGQTSAILSGQVSRNLYPAGSNQDPWHLGGGIELGIARLTFVRLGYQHDHSLKGLTWGVGLEQRGIRIDVGVDSDIYDSVLRYRSVRFQFSWHL
jgi:hypothetical protein